MIAPLRAGQIVAKGRYRLVRQIGRGSFGDVFLADDLTAQEGSQVAVLKVLHQQWAQVPQVIERFRRESNVTRMIEHPHVARVFENGMLEEGVPFIAMEYLHGPSLREELAKGPFPLPRALPVLAAICEALGAAHRAGVVHRDLKPENILLVERDGRPDHPVVLDFGVAKFLDAAERLTMTGAVLGTPAYMPPEQFRGEQDLGPPADVYALAVLTFEVCTGRPPFVGRNFAELAIAHTGTPAPPLPGVPKEVAQIIARALEKDPSRRPVADDLARVMRGQKALPPAKPKAPSPDLMATVVNMNMDTVVSDVTYQERQQARQTRMVRVMLGGALTILFMAISLFLYFLVLHR